MFIIRLNRIEGLDLIIKALRSMPDVASQDLAIGIERTVIYHDQIHNTMTLVNPPEHHKQIDELQSTHKSDPKCICRGFYKPTFCPVHGVLQ